MSTRFLVPLLASLALVVACAGSSPRRGETARDPDDPLDFWARPRRGANFFHESLSAARFAAAADYGIELVRLSPTELPTEARDFLVGSADAYDGLLPADVATVRAALDMAHAEGLGVVVTMLTLPGSRWRQHHGGETDLRIYRDRAFHAQAARFWRDLARALRGHPALVGYDVMNEPRPEEAMPGECATRRGTAADLDAIHRAIVAAIREVDPLAPIILEPGMDASAAALDCVEPIDDGRVIYSVHLYEPWELTTWRRNPGRVAYGAGPEWDRRTLEEALAPLERWARRHELPASRIFLGEIGIDRRVPGAAQYLADALDIASDAGWHWAFYAFREDDWDGMDYELGSAPIDESARPAVRRGDDAGGLRRAQPPFDGIVRALRR